jgi:hypothetical protein
MTRAVLRHVTYTVRTDTESGFVWEAACAADGCDAESGPQDSEKDADLFALRHAGLTGHMRFRRTVSGHANVYR